MDKAIRAYNSTQSKPEAAICTALMKAIDQALPDAESKLWHAHPVWFLDGNPVVGYSKLKRGIRLLFWSGASFDESALQPGTGKFQDASILYSDVKDIRIGDLKRWLKKARSIQWDYKNVVKRKGRLERLK